MRSRWHILSLVASLGLVAAVEPVPWPYGVGPTSDQIRQQVADALRIARRERFEEVDAAQLPTEERGALVVHRDEVVTYDAELLFQLGDAIFAHEFSPHDGYGGLLPGPPFLRVHQGTTGGLDTTSCAGCHTVGGLDGAGTFAQNALLLGDGDRSDSAAARNPPALLGLGLVQALAVEMSTTLQQARAEAVGRAAREGRPVTVALLAKGVSFGELTVAPDGTVDSSAFEGVSADLVIRPFGWKGDVARLRRFAEEAARVHFGVITVPLEQSQGPVPDLARVGGGAPWDRDGDGVLREIEEGSLIALAVYLTLLETPVVAPPADPTLLARWAAGDRQFDALGCAACHVRELLLVDRVWEEQPDTPGPALEVALLEDGEHPRGLDRVNLFSDLKRHDMGETLADRVDHPDGIPRAEFLTRPLWGLAETAPYLHNGAALTVEDAILAHAGEAAPARDAYAALPATSRADLAVFLLSLTRHPKVRVAR